MSDNQPSITIGTRLTDNIDFDLTVEGMASGGMGLVVWGPDPNQGGERIAAKLLRPDQATDLQFKAAFEQEALTWCYLWYHPCILPAIGLTRLPAWGGLPVLALLYASKGTLRSWLQRTRSSGRALPLSTAFNWAQHVAGGLIYLHTPDPRHERPHPLVHCDLKPENILIGDQYQALLTDLGLARVWAASAPPPEATRQPEQASLEWMPQHSQRIAPLTGVHAVGSRGAVVGTPPYMPPEQWLGVDAVVPASDVYAMGIVLFELFAGVRGWPHAPSEAGWLGWYRAHQQGPRYRLSDADRGAVEAGPLSALFQQAGESGNGRALAEEVREELSRLIEACLEREERARPKAAEVLEGLGTLAERVGLKRSLEILPPFTGILPVQSFTITFVSQKTLLLDGSTRAGRLLPRRWHTSAF